MKSCLMTLVGVTFKRTKEKGVTVLRVISIYQPVNRLMAGKIWVDSRIDATGKH